MYLHDRGRICQPMSFLLGTYKLVVGGAQNWKFVTQFSKPLKPVYGQFSTDFSCCDPK